MEHGIGAQAFDTKKRGGHYVKLLVDLFAVRQFALLRIGRLHAAWRGSMDFDASSAWPTGDCLGWDVTLSMAWWGHILHSFKPHADGTIDVKRPQGAVCPPRRMHAVGAAFKAGSPGEPVIIAVCRIF